MRSPQTLSEADRRAVAGWAADCAEHVLPIFEDAIPGDRRPRDLIARARRFASGELTVAEGIRDRFAGGVPAAELAQAPAAAAAAAAAGQAAAIPHLGAHAIGAAAYAARAAGLAEPERVDAAGDETHWQLSIMPAEVRTALRLLPPAGTNSAGPLGPGLLTSGSLGAIVAELQARLGAESPAQ